MARQPRRRVPARRLVATRHTNPKEQHHGPANLERTGVLIATTLHTKPDRWTGKTEPLGRYWIPEGATTGSNLATGPGYRAHANDVPEGTRLVITARIELPEEQQEAATQSCPVCDGTGGDHQIGCHHDTQEQR